MNEKNAISVMNTLMAIFESGDTSLLEGPLKRDLPEFTQLIIRSPTIERSLYSLLGVEAGHSHIRKLLRQLILRFHPDKRPDDENAIEITKSLTSLLGQVRDASLKNNTGKRC